MLKDILQIDIDKIDYSDEDSVKRVVRVLLNAVEELCQEKQKLEEENQRIKDENSRLKGGNAKPEIKANVATRDSSSEESPKTGSKKKRRRKSRRKRSKKPRNKRSELNVTKTEVIPVDRQTLPPDAEHKGYRDVTIQELTIEVDVIRFRLERFTSESTGQFFEAKLPQKYQGYEHGPGVRAYILDEYFGQRVTEPKILKKLQDIGIQISSGHISDIITRNNEEFHTEKDEIHKSGILSTPYQHLDDTGARINGRNQHYSVLCNEYYSVFFTHPRKDRLSVIEILLANQEMQFRIDERTIELLADTQLPQKYFEPLRQNILHLSMPEETITTKLKAMFSKLPARYLSLIIEAAAIAHYRSLAPEDQIQIIIADDARQFKKITEYLGLCWVHEGRHYSRLSPVFEIHQKKLDEFLERFWDYYERLKKYKEKPTGKLRQALWKDFDELFAPNTGYEQLDHTIELTAQKKDQLLLVLDHPEIPLHNNPAELALREWVIKRKISIGTRSEGGTKAWETFLSISDTCRKLGISFFAYLKDRVSKENKIPRLSGLILEKANKEFAT